MNEFEDKLHEERLRVGELCSGILHQFLLSMKEVDERLPECPDVEDKWEPIAKAYIPDGIREFQDFPSASIGWMMYIGMAVAKLWDTECDAPTHRAWHQGGFQRLRLVSASALPDGSSHAAEAYGDRKSVV